MTKSTRSKPFPGSLRQPSSLSGLLALAVAGNLTGCSLIKINGKPLGSSANNANSHSSSSSSSGSLGGDETADGKAEPSGRKNGPFAWCAFGKHADRNDTVAQLDIRIKDDEERSGLTFAANTFAEALCTTEGELASQRSSVLKRRDAWLMKHQLDERDFIVLFEQARNLSQELAEFETFDGPVGQYGKLTGYPFERLLATDKLGNAASTLARVALVQSCFNTQNSPYKQLADYPLLTSILCTRVPIDLAKARQEIDSNKELNTHSRYWLRRVAVRASDAVKTASAELTALGKEDPGVATLIAMADREHKQWATPTAQRSKLLAQLSMMEAAEIANKRSAFAGCADRTVADWVAHLATLKLPASPDRDQLETYTNATLATAEGYLAFRALRLCSRSEETSSTNPRSEPIGVHVTRRGPITASMASWLRSDKPIEFDDRDRSIPRLFAESELGGPTNFSIDSNVHAGVIGSIEDVEGGVEVRFKTVREPRITCMRTESTNRIQSIGAGGGVNYEQRCLSTGKVMMDITAKPVKFGKAMSRGLRPGMYLVAVFGIPVVATRSPNSDTPIFVLGGLLK